MNSRYLIVTLVLQRPMKDYSQLQHYRDEFDWEFACAPTATTKSMLFFTDKPEKEIRERINSLISSDDFCAVDSYDSTEGGPHISAQAERIRQWISR